MLPLAAGLGNLNLWADETPNTIAAELNAANQLNVVGPYGNWLANHVLGGQPGKLSLRSGQWKDIDAWRTAARKRALECIAPVDFGKTPEVRVDSQHDYDGLHFKHLSWQLPGGPRSEAVLLRPVNTTGPLPGILGLHDHSGNKFLGWRKIVRTDDSPWEVQQRHHEHGYDGLAWANQIAKRGYVVLVHDTFPFGSRRVRVADVPSKIREGGVDPGPHDIDGIEKYNRFARSHEHIMEKSL